MGLGYSSSQSTEAKGPTILVPSLEPDTDKWCWGCGQYKDISMFYSDASRGAGISYLCKPCDVKTRRKNKKAKRLTATSGVISLTKRNI